MFRGRSESLEDEVLFAPPATVITEGNTNGVLNLTLDDGRWVVYLIAYVISKHSASVDNNLHKEFGRTIDSAGLLVRLVQVNGQEIDHTTGKFAIH